MTKPFVIVVDLDGTLCNAGHRDQYAVAGQWEEFHSRLMDDEPWPDVKTFMDAVHPDERLVVVCLTGRNEKWRGLTYQWMAKHSVYPDMLLMRPDDDYTPDAELKPRMLMECFKAEEIMMILEDREKVVDAWRNLGFNCWQVRPGGY